MVVVALVIAVCAKTAKLASGPKRLGLPGQIISGTAELGVVGASNTLVQDIIDATTNIGARVAIPAPIGAIITILPGINYGAAAITFTGSPVLTLVFDALGNPNAQFFITSDSAIIFTATNMLCINSAQPANIFLLAKVANITFDATSNQTSGNLLAASGVTFAGPAIINGNVLAFGGPVTFAANSIVNAPIVCYLKGTKILTENGYVAIEHLSVGDKIATKGKIVNDEYINEQDELTYEPITWTGNFRAPNLNKQSFPICITAHAFGENMPFENLYISPAHRILLDGKMVLAGSLINGTTIFQDCNYVEIEYYHLQLESHSSIVANGVLAETYFDFDNSAIFENKPVVTSVQLPQAITA